MLNKTHITDTESKIKTKCPDSDARVHNAENCGGQRNSQEENENKVKVLQKHFLLRRLVRQSLSY
jgi:hypothetical protein